MLSCFITFFVAITSIGSTLWCCLTRIFLLFSPIADGITTGSLGFLILLFFNSISLVPSFSSLFSTLTWLEILFVYEFICWYFGDFTSRTARTFDGKHLLITFNCASLYWLAMLSKLSTYFASSFPILL